MEKILAFGVLILVFGIGLSQADAQQTKKQRSERRSQQDALRVADLAPTFVLKSLGEESETDLASLRDKKPVVLIFGSYT